MTIVARGNGTASKVASGNMTPTLPSGWQANDFALLAVIGQNGDTFSVSGWTNLYNQNNNAGGNNSQGAVYYRRLQGGDTDPTVSGAASGSMSVIRAYQSVKTSDPAYNTSSVLAPAESLTFSTSSITPANATDMLVALALIEAPFAAPSMNTWSDSFTEVYDDFNSLGASWTMIGIAEKIAGGTSAVAPTATISTTTGAIFVGVMIALTEQSGGGGIVVAPMPYPRLVIV